MLTTVKTMTRKKKETAHQNLEKNFKKYKKNLEKKQLLYWRKKTLTQHQHGRFMQKFWNFKRESRTKTKRERKIINTAQISPDTHHSTPKSCLIIRRQQANHSSQLSLQLEDLTIQAANLRKDRVFLVSILQHDVVVLQIPHIGLQLLDASLHVQPSVLQLRLLEQRLLVFQVPTLPIPPVTN